MSDRISHNHGPEDGPGLNCRQHPTGDCVIQALTARAEAAEAKVAAGLHLHENEHYDKWGRRQSAPQGSGGWCTYCGNFPGARCSTRAALEDATP